MDYEKKYKEGVEWLRDWIYLATTGEMREQMEKHFPELKESEDERIRKDLIQWINEFPDTIWRGHYKKDVIAWLEKQKAVDILDEEEREFADNVDSYRKEVDAAYQKGYNEGVKATLEKQGESSIYNTPSREVILAIWDLGNEWKELTNGSISTEYGTQLDYIQNHWQESEYYLREKQNPTDKVEPKFHEGDWAVSNLDRKARQISEVHFDDYNSYYVVDGKSVNLEEYDRLHHLWTIQDAKDGDVLYECNEKKPFIFKELETKHIGDIASYCDIFDGIFNPNEDDWTTLDVVPATKEQHDLLFQKMKEARYEWDEKNKELKKIPNAFEECKIVHVEHGKYYYCIKDYYAGGNKRASKGDVVQAVNGMSMMALGVKANEYFMPVNTIKQMSAWSEEDEIMIKVLDSIIRYIVEIVDKDALERFGTNREELFSWLKSLRPQNKWKPSNEQIIAFEQVYDWYNNNFAPSETLTSLYSDLKKLKGE